ncbi:MAG TPA: hypothetical protein VEZ11_12640 [Thermoanaerobaculia bacterium]|nr:hypothetical protein [Thermoanaerobaculia bacterium]
MRLGARLALILLFVPLMASAQFKDLDAAMSSLSKGFGGGDAQAIVAGVAEGDQVQLQFPGLVSQSGFFGRDQASYLLDGLFAKVNARGFQQLNTRKDSTKGQYEIVASWTIQPGGHAEVRDLYITLRSKNDRWILLSVRSASK